ALRRAPAGVNVDLNMEKPPPGQLGAEKRGRLEDRSRLGSVTRGIKSGRWSEDGAVVVVGPAILLHERRGDQAVEPPQGQAQVAGELPLAAGVELLLFQAQRRPGRPAQAADDQGRNQQEGNESAPFAAEPGSHDEAPFAEASPSGCRSGPAM